MLFHILVGVFTIFFSFKIKKNPKLKSESKLKLRSFMTEINRFLVFTDRLIRLTVKLPGNIKNNSTCK